MATALSVAQFISDELSGVSMKDGEVVAGGDVYDSVVVTRAFTSLTIGDKEFFVEVKELRPE